jgi:hypothetical protein
MCGLDLKILDFSIDIGGVVYENSLMDDIRIDKTNLDEECATQAEKFAYYGAAAELAKSREAYLKNDLDVLYAQIEHEKRQAANTMQIANSKFKFTEKMCESEVITDKRYQAKKKEYLDAKKLTGLLTVGKDAFNHRREALISLGANQRVGANDTRILKQTVKSQIAEKKSNKNEQEPEQLSRRRKPASKTV